MNAFRVFAPLAILALTTGAEAASVSLVPSAGTVAQNSSFTVAIALNASDAPGSHPGGYLGEVVIDFDPLQLLYQGFAATSPVALSSGPTTASAGSRQTVTLGFYNASDLSEIGKLTFRAQGSPGTVAGIGIADADDFFGTFISKVPTDQPFYPQFNDTSVNISAVPLPASAWLFMTGFGVIGARARRKSLARRRHAQAHAGSS